MNYDTATEHLFRKKYANWYFERVPCRLNVADDVIPKHARRWAAIGPCREWVSWGTRNHRYLRVMPWIFFLLIFARLRHKHCHPCHFCSTERPAIESIRGVERTCWTTVCQDCDKLFWSLAWSCQHSVWLYEIFFSLSLLFKQTSSIPNSAFSNDKIFWMQLWPLTSDPCIINLRNESYLNVQSRK